MQIHQPVDIKYIFFPFSSHYATLTVFETQNDSFPVPPLLNYKTKLFKKCSHGILRLFFLPPPPTSHDLQYISVTCGFTRLSMETKYVCRGLIISLYVNFHSNRTMWSTNLHVKICRWGKRKKSPFCMLETCRNLITCSR